MQKMPQARKSGLIIKETEGEILIYDQQSNKAHCLNPTAARVWKYCDGRTTIAEACTLLSRDLEEPLDEKIVWFAIDQFSNDNLLEEKAFLPGFISGGMNRRQMVRTLGLAAVVALPLVTTIVAPTPAQAATCVPPGGACTTSAECCAPSVCTGSPLVCT